MSRPESKDTAPWSAQHGRYGTNMDKDFSRRYAELQDRHWWFRGRAVVLRKLLESVPLADGATVLEIGVGPGRDIGRVYPANVRVVGLEPDPDLAATARRHTQAEVHCGTLEALPEAIAEARFQAIALFDVLEHVEDDGHALRILAERLAPDGRLVLTVAAYSWMWCQHDEVNHHFRRYSRKSLTGTLRQAGFRPVTSTYFNSFLFVAIAAFRVASRLFQRRGLPPTIKRAGRSDFDVSLGPFDALFFRVLSLEARFIGRVRFPFGVSLFMVADRAG